MTEICDVAPGLWTWRLEHPDYRGDPEWDGTVTCTCVESGGEVAVLDPPPRGELREPLRRARLGPTLFFPGGTPEIPLEPISRGSELPGGLLALWDGRGQVETPLWLPEQRALVFADGMTAPNGELRIWASPEHERWACRPFAPCSSCRSST